MKKRYKFLTIVALMTVFSCGKNETETKDGRGVVAVKLGGESRSGIGGFVMASGKIEAENSANVSTRMMGYITKIHVKTGQHVSAGQLLVSINNTDLQAKKAQVDAGIQQATAAYNSAKKDYERFVALFAQQSASQKELDDMTARFEMAKAGLESARQMRNEVQAQFSYANLTAPFSGTVMGTFLKEGDMATPGMPIVSVEGASRLQVTAMVGESNINAVKTGMPVKVLVKSSGQTIAGKVSEVSTSAKNTGGQYLVKINLDKTDASVLAGMFVNVQFAAAPADKTKVDENVSVPEHALVRQGQLTGIYTVGNGNTAILRWVRTGKTFGDQVEILSGLSTGEPYIVSADGKLYNGAKISIQ